MNSRIRLRAFAGEPLGDEGVRGIVVSTARAIGERTGVRVEVHEADLDTIELEVEGSNLEATALAAELRRITDQWHQQRHGRPLWGEP
ncbi:MAG: hypothetical protein P8J45_04470 [Phycisphaerales bacterium]|nr:hypothetical protein [Phycisphaerales bacterium]